MSRRGACWANGCSETLLGSLKVEWLYGQKLKARRQAKDEVIDWLLRSDQLRPHSTLAHVSPMKFEQDWLANQPRQVNSWLRYGHRFQGQGQTANPLNPQLPAYRRKKRHAQRAKYVSSAM
jgi:hypothetical protein